MESAAKTFNGNYLVTLLLAFICIIPSVHAQSDDPSRNEQILSNFSADSYQTDLFTGASTSKIDIHVPPAAGAETPKIMLRYISSMMDELKPGQQGSSVGTGWALDIGGYVIRNMHDTNSTNDDTFKITFA